MDSNIRIFFAIDLPEDVKQFIHDQVWQFPALRMLSWIPLQNLHLTLRFIGSVSKESLPDIISQVKSQIKTIASFSIELTELIYFPSLEHPKILAFDVRLNDMLHDLVKQINKGVIAAGRGDEDRPFRPHVTLSKLSRGTELFSLPKFAKSIAIHVKEIFLFSTQSGKEGNKYLPLEIFGLK